MKIGAFEPTFGIRIPMVRSVFSAAPKSGAAATPVLDAISAAEGRLATPRES